MAGLAVRSDDSIVEAEGVATGERGPNLRGEPVAVVGMQAAEPRLDAQHRRLRRQAAKPQGPCVHRDLVRIGLDGHPPCPGGLHGPFEGCLAFHPCRFKRLARQPGQHAFGHFDSRVQHPDDGAGLVDDRAEAVVEPRVAQAVPPVEAEQRLMEPDGFAALCRRHLRADHVGPLAPDLRHAVTECVRLAAKQRHVGVVIGADDQVVACQHDAGHAAAQHGFDHRPQGKRPSRARPQPSGRPVEAVHAGRHPR